MSEPDSSRRPARRWARLLALVLCLCVRVPVATADQINDAALGFSLTIPNGFRR